MKKTTLSSAGRVLSQRNADRLKVLFAEIGNILVEAKVVALSDLKEILGKEGKEPEDDVENKYFDEELKELSSAGRFADSVRTATWFQSIRQSLDIFQMQFCDLQRMSESQLERVYGSGADRDKLTREMISDLNDFLAEYADKRPKNNDDYIDGYYPHPMYASAKEDEEVENTTDPSDRDVNTSEIDESSSNSEEELEEMILSAPEPKEIQTRIVFDCPAQEIVASKQGRRGKKANHFPIEGVLFRIDEPSETAPAKGSSLPLYVPKEVAELAAAGLLESKGLPLDVDDSLSQHANKEIAGVMTEAHITGQDFVVRGHLFPWSQSEKVSLISANKERLGMSMNAHATGHHAKVNGVDVYWIDSLELLGANILYSDRATYQQTRLLAAEIAASGNFAPAEQPNQNYELNNMDIERQLEKMTETLATISAASQADSDRIVQLQAQIEAQNRVIQEFQAEREARNNLLQTQQSEESRQRERSELVAAMAEALDQRLSKQKEELLDVVNPKRQPQQLTRPLVSLVAQGKSQEHTTEMHQELIAAQAKLSVYEEQGITGPQRIALVEQINELASRLRG